MSYVICKVSSLAVSFSHEETLAIPLLTHLIGHFTFPILRFLSNLTLHIIFFASFLLQSCLLSQLI